MWPCREMKGLIKVGVVMSLRSFMAAIGRGVILDTSCQSWCSRVCKLCDSREKEAEEMSDLV
jgi:hypothetical protein